LRRIDPAAPSVPPVFSTRGQLGRDAAIRYQEVAVPWIHGPFAAALVELAAPRRGESVLDVGCGTGAAARVAAAAVGPTGRVVGLDINVGRLEVARSLDASTERGPGDPEPATIEWMEASADAMPLPNASFDLVVSAQAIQFPPDTDAAAAELRRVLRPGGRAAVSVWREPSTSPLFAAEIATVVARLGAEAVGGFLAAFEMADPARLVTSLAAAGLENVDVSRIDLLLDLPPLADWAPRHLAGTSVAPALASAAPGLARELGADIAQALADYMTPDGVRVPFSSWVIQGRTPAT